MACPTIDLQQYIDATERKAYRRITVKPITFQEPIDITRYVNPDWSWGSNKNDAITSLDFCICTQIDGDECDDANLLGFADDDGIIYTYPLKVTNPSFRLISHNTEICIEKKLGYTDCVTGIPFIEPEWVSEWSGYISDIKENGDEEICVTVVDKLKILQNHVLFPDSYPVGTIVDTLESWMNSAISSTDCQWSTLYNPYGTTGLGVLDAFEYDKCTNLLDAMQELAGYIGGQIRALSDPSGTCVPACECRVGIYIEGRSQPGAQTITLNECHGGLKTGCTDTDIVNKVVVVYTDVSIGAEFSVEESNVNSQLWLGGDAGLDLNGDYIPRPEGIRCAKIDVTESSAIGSSNSANLLAQDYLERSAKLRGQVQMVLDFPLPCVDFGDVINLLDSKAFDEAVELEINSFQHTKYNTTLNLSYCIEFPEYEGSIG